MNFKLKLLIRRIKCILYGFHHREVKRYISYFDKKDFIFERKGKKYYLTFDNSLGCYKENYNPVFYFDFWSGLWITELQGITWKSYTCPCFELIAELRGYLLKKELKQGDIIIDGGAASGFITTYFAMKIEKIGKIIALEPDDRLRKILRFNLKTNNISNVIILKEAIFNQKGSFYFNPKTLSLSTQFVEDEEENMIKTLTLKDIISTYYINESKISFLKFDIEGAEVEIFEDVANLILENKNCQAVFASYHLRENKQTSNVLEQIAKEKYPNLICETTFPLHPTTYLSYK